MKTLDEYYQNQNFPTDPKELEEYIQRYVTLLGNKICSADTSSVHAVYETYSNKTNNYFLNLLTKHHFGESPPKIEFKAKTTRMKEERWSIDLKRTNPFCWHYGGSTYHSLNLDDQIESALSYKATSTNSNATDKQIHDWLADARLFLFIGCGCRPSQQPFYKYLIERIFKSEKSKYFFENPILYTTFSAFHVHTNEPEHLKNITRLADIFSFDLTEKALIIGGTYNNNEMKLTFGGKHSLVTDFWKTYISGPQLIDEARVARVLALLEKTQKETSLLNEMSGVI